MLQEGSVSARDIRTSARWGLGGEALSNLVAGWIVEFAGFSAGFLFLAGTAILGGLLFAFLMPENAPHRIAARATKGSSSYGAD